MTCKLFAIDNANFPSLLSKPVLHLQAIHKPVEPVLRGVFFFVNEMSTKAGSFLIKELALLLKGVGVTQIEWFGLRR